MNWNVDKHKQTLMLPHSKALCLYMPLSICRVCIAFISTQTNANTHDDDGGGGGREMQKRRALIAGKKDVRSAHKRGREKKVAQSHTQARERKTRWWRIETITTKWPMLKTKIENRKRGREKNVNPDGWMDGWICFVDPGRRPSVQESFVGDVDIVDILPPCAHRRRACLCRESICVYIRRRSQRLFIWAPLIKKNHFDWWLLLPMPPASTFLDERWLQSN